MLTWMFWGGLTLLATLALRRVQVSSPELTPMSDEWLRHAQTEMFKPGRRLRGEIDTEREAIYG